MNVGKIIIIVFCVYCCGFMDCVMMPLCDNATCDNAAAVQNSINKIAFDASYTSSSCIVGTAGLCGTRPYMEDTHVDYNPDSSFACYGVFDGHGGVGVAQKLAQELPQRIKKYVDHHPKDIPAALKHVCAEFDTELIAEYKDGVAAFNKEIDQYGVARKIFANSMTSFKQTQGSTAVMMLSVNENLYFCNVGDSQIVGYNNHGKVCVKSQFHNTYNQDECRRIAAVGAYLKYHYNPLGQRIGYVESALAMTRAFGDAYLKRWVICEPDVIRVTKKHALDFVIIASDGFWDVVTPDMAYFYVNEYCCVHNVDRKKITEKHALAIAHMLANVALVNCSRDNITVKVVFLKS